MAVGPAERGSSDFSLSSKMAGVGIPDPTPSHSMPRSTSPRSTRPTHRIARLAAAALVLVPSAHAFASATNAEPQHTDGPTTRVLTGDRGERAPTTLVASTAATLRADWKRDFIRAERVGDRDGMARIAERHATEFSFWIYSLAERVIADDEDEEGAELFEAAKLSWARAFESEFGDKVLAYLQGLDDQDRLDRVAAVNRYRDLAIEYLTKRAEEASAARDTQIQELGMQLDALGTEFYELGDMYYASRAWIFSGDSASPRAVREGAANQVLELTYLRKAVEACDLFDVGDREHTESRARIKAIERAIANGKTAGSVTEASSSPEVLAFGFGPAVAHATTPTVLDDMRKRVRLAYGWDEQYPTWQTVYLGNIGAQAPLPGMEDGPHIERQGTAEVVVVDADGRARFVELSPVPQIVKTRVGTGDDARDYAFEIRIGERTSKFQGFRVDSRPTVDSMTVYMRPVAAAEFQFGKDTIYVTDDNFDGVFGSPPDERGRVGLPLETLQPHLDGVFVDKAKLAMPFSEIMCIGGTWVRVEPRNGGRTFQVSEATDLPVGKVKLVYKGADLEWAVIRGAGPASDLFYLVEPGRSVEVPAADYHIYTGVVRDGDMKALMIRGDAETFTVREGDEMKVTLGGPFAYDFTWSLVEDEVRVKGDSVHVRGIGGEHYHLLWNCRAVPEVHVRPAGRSAWSQVGVMELLGKAKDVDDLGPEGWAMAWTPLDLLVENKYGDEVEVRLHERKNGLFGRIDSDL